MFPNTQPDVHKHTCRL